MCRHDSLTIDTDHLLDYFPLWSAKTVDTKQLQIPLIPMVVE